MSSRLKMILFGWRFWLLAAASLYFSQSLLYPGFPDSHEGLNYPVRFEAFCGALAEGEWDARWIGQFAYGFGYPLFNFFPPGLFYAAAPLRGLGLSYAWSLKCITLISCLLGTLGAFWLGRRVWRNATAAFWTALIFTVFPYRATDLTVRGALSELLALNIMPCLLWAFLGIADCSSARRVIGAGALFAALVWTHNVSALVIAAVLLIFPPMIWAMEGSLARKTWIAAGIAYSLGIGLSIAFWAPALLEARFAHLSALYIDDYDARNQLLSWRRLFDGGWGHGPSIGDNDTQMGFGLGWFVWTGIAAACARLLLDKDMSRETRRKLAICFSFFIIFVFLTLRASLPFWKLAAPARLVQFPWRLLGLAGLMSALAIGAAAGALEQLPRRWVILSAFALTFAICAGSWNRFQPSGWLTATDAGVQAIPRHEFESTTINNEYMPIHALWARDQQYKKEYTGGGLVGVDGPGAATLEWQPIIQKGHDKVFSISLRAPAGVGFHQYYFPGWSARLDGRPLDIVIAENGMMIVDAPAGAARLEFRFADTPVRRAAKWCNLCFALFALIWLARGKQKKTAGD